MKNFTLSFLAILCTVLNLNAELFIVGKMTGWDTGKAQQMEETESGVYTWTGSFSANDDFKFLVARSWDQCYTSNTEVQTLEPVESGTSYTLYYKPQNTGPDSKFQMVEAGNYTVVVDINEMTMVCTLNKDVVDTDLYLVGAGTPAGWSPANAKNWKMEKQERHYTWSGPLTHAENGGRFVFLANSDGNWWPRYTSDNTAESRLEIEPGQNYTLRRYDSEPAGDGWKDPAFAVNTPGFYTITADLSEDISEGTFSIEEGTVCVLGPAISVSGTWDFGDISRYPMTNNGDGTYSFTGDFKAGDFRLNLAGKWWPSFIAADADNNIIAADGTTLDSKFANDGKAFAFEADGYYELTLDLNDNPQLTVKRLGDYGEQPEVPLTELYICGNALNGKEGGWDKTEEYIQAMTPTANQGEFTWTGYLYPGEFKFRYNGPGDGNWDGMVADYESNVTIGTDDEHPIADNAGKPDSKFVINNAGNYTVIAKTFGDTKSMHITYNGTTGVENLISPKATFTVSDRVISVDGEAEIFDTMGRSIARFADGAYTLPCHGVFIVSAGGTVSRIAVK